MAARMSDVNCEASCFLERVEINILDMKSEPSNGFSFIGHAEDQYTNFCVLFPLKDDSPKEIALCLKKHFISYFGPPVSFVSGSGKSLLPDVLCEVLECWKGDGLAFTLSDSRKLYSESKKSEIITKFVRDNISMMAAVSSEDNSWSDWLPEIMLKLNVCRHTSRHLNPYSAVFQQKTSALLLTEQQDLRLDGDVSDNGVEEMPEVTNEDPRKKEILRYLKLQRGDGQQQKIKKTSERGGTPGDTVASTESKPATSDTSVAMGDTDDAAALQDMVKGKQEKCDPGYELEATEANSKTSKHQRSSHTSAMHGNVQRMSKPGQESEISEKQTVSDEEAGGESVDEAEDSDNGPGLKDPDHDGNGSKDTFQFFEIKRKLSLEDHTYIERLKAEDPVITLSEIKLRLRHERNVEVHVSTISRAIKRMTAFQESDGDPHCSNTEETEQHDLPVTYLFNQDELDSLSCSQSDEAEEEQNTPRTNFLPQDDVFLKGLLNITPLLSVDEIRKRLEKERGLAVSADNLNRKIAAMTNMMNKGGQGTKNKRQKPGMVNLPVSEVGPRVGKLAYRNLPSSSRSVEAKHRQTQAFTGSYSREETLRKVTDPSDHSYREVAASASGCYKKGHIKRNVAAASVREYTLDADSFDSSDDDEDDSDDEDLPPVHFGEMQNQNFENLDIYKPQQTGFHFKQYSTESSKKPTKRSLQNVIIDLSQNQPPSKKLRQTGDVPSSFQSQYTDSRKGNMACKRNSMEDPQEYSFVKETNSSKSGTLQKADLNFLKKLKYKNPLITLNEVKNRFLVERDLDVDIHCVSRAMKNIFMDKDNSSKKETQKRQHDNHLDGGGVSFPYDPEELQDSATAQGHVASSSSSPQPEAGQASVKEGEALDGASDNQNYSFADEPRTINATRKLTFGDIQYIYHLRQDNANITLKEIKAKLSSELHLDVHLSTISRALKKMKKEIDEIEKERLT